MEDIVALFIPLGICVVLPVMVVWLTMRKSMNETNKRAEIALEAIRNNADIDVEEFFKKMTPEKKLIKEKLLAKLQKACIFLVLGLGLLVFAGIKGYQGNCHPDTIEVPALVGTISTLIGGALLIVYFISKKSLAKEIEAETKALENNAVSDEQ